MSSDVQSGVDLWALSTCRVTYWQGGVMRYGWNLAYWGKQTARWLVQQLAFTLGSVPRRELFFRLFIVGLGIGMLVAVRAQLVGK